VAIGRLAGGIAHDFNNILTGISGHIELMLAGIADNSPIRDDLLEVKHLSNRAMDLTGQLLAFSRQQPTGRVVLDLNRIVQDLAVLLKRIIGEHIDLDLQAGAASGTICADRAQIEQVVMNLAVNARDAMPLGGKLVIETADVMLDDAQARDHTGAKSGPHVMLAVTDTGCGMDRVTLDHVFDRFFTTKAEGHGTGIGLATVDGIIRQCGGHVCVRSESGKGTCFKVFLPAAAGTASKDEPITEPWDSTSRSGTVLIVEDEDSVRAVAERILRECGYDVLSAASPSEAEMRAAAHDGDITLLLTDIVLPERSGTDLYETLVAARPGLRVLYMSGYTCPSIRERGMPRRPSAPFLQKPFTAGDLARKVNQACEE